MHTEKVAEPQPYRTPRKPNLKVTHRGRNNFIVKLCSTYMHRIPMQTQNKHTLGLGSFGEARLEDQSTLNSARRIREPNRGPYSGPNHPQRV